MVESRQILYSMLAGVAAGAVGSVVIAVTVSSTFNEFLYEVVYHQLASSGVGRAAEVANLTVQSVGQLAHWLLPVAPLINGLLLGVLLGLLLDLLTRRLHIKPWAASLITGLTYVALLQALPLTLVSLAYGRWIVDLLARYVGLAAVFAPSATYTATLLLLNTVKGPWTRLGEAEPEIY